MPNARKRPSQDARTLSEAARLNSQKILNPPALVLHGGVTGCDRVLVLLAAGKGTRFGQNPKCIQPIHGTPLARHSIDAFRWLAPRPVICLVGYRHEEVAAALGSDNIYVLSDNPTGGTALPAFESLCVPGLLESNPLLIITMGDRIVPSSVFRMLCETHCAEPREADLSFLTARYEQSRIRGKGRVLRNESGRVVRIVEDRDLAAEKDELVRQALLTLTEGNCPLYAVRAATLHRHLATLTNGNAQGQYYLTDLVEAVSRAGGDIRTITTTPADPEYDLLCSDVTHPIDLALLEGKMASAIGLFAEIREVEDAARAIAVDRPGGQVASIACQLEELVVADGREKLGFRSDSPVGIGIAGGRLRIAFMHPDMVRFFGPAWQMPIGAGSEVGREQIVVLSQGADDRRVHLYPLDPKYRECVNSVPSDQEAMYPGRDISDWNTYEGFGTRMSETLLLSLGYFSNEELERRRQRGQPLPPPSLWISNNMRRPFALVGNAIASMRTLREGSLGARVQQRLGRESFKGLRLVCTGNIPQGGFSSSSAVTVATKNSINALFEIGIPPDVLVHLATQAEYGTGVRAGSLDQATAQKGRAGQGTLISSSPRDNYRIIGTYPVPTERFQVIFPYSVERDREAWRWSWGMYAAGADSDCPTTGELRKMTGKAAELAAILTRLPLDVDLFSKIEDDLVQDGLLGVESRVWICSVLRALPLLISQDELRQRVSANTDWYVGELIECGRLDPPTARHRAESTFDSVFAGWRDPVLRRAPASGPVLEERGVPLRAMVAYLFGETAKNFYLVHHREEWIEYVTRSQRGDCCVEIDPDRLPSRAAMEREQDWERDLAGPELLNRWLERYGAAFCDFNRGLDDQSLSPENPPAFHHLEGSGFFRGLALIDLAGAMLKRAFGRDAVAVRVNAAGQGDYFQVHIDKLQANVEDVEGFIRKAFYRRFGLSPEPEFVALHPGGGAVGLRLSRYDMLPQVIRRLRSYPGSA
ncbi:MAG TPA: NTP transferase domain-containing protein [Phycisphaerae bacterium]|nr:NTP transferase domain-containing protein [Phycisphaerae bacterium]HSA27675.1 NTP transferase domain-containing protein [Phycisphaerae bacterium]